MCSVGCCVDWLLLFVSTSSVSFTLTVMSSRTPTCRRQPTLMYSHVVNFIVKLWKNDIVAICKKHVWSSAFWHLWHCNSRCALMSNLRVKFWRSWSHMIYAKLLLLQILQMESCQISYLWMWTTADQEFTISTWLLTEVENIMTKFEGRL